MGVSTITAARIYKGQQEQNVAGEEHEFIFDKFPNTALVKVRYLFLLCTGCLSNNVKCSGKNS